MLVDAPAALAGATAVLAQQGQQPAPGQGLQELKGPLATPVTGALMQGGTQRGTFEGELTDARVQDPTANGQ